MIAFIGEASVGRVMTRDEAIVHVAEAKRNGRRVVFTCGRFELLHPGHVRCLEGARSLGDILVVGVNSDAGASPRKDKGRPLVAQEERAEILCALQAVDVVVVFDSDTLRQFITRLSPDVLVARGNGRPGEIIGREEVEAAGGRVVSIPAVPGYSTAAILRRIRKPLGKDKGLSSSGANTT